MKENGGLFPVIFIIQLWNWEKNIKSIAMTVVRVNGSPPLGILTHEYLTELNKFVKLRNIPEMAVGVGSVTDASRFSYICNGCQFYCNPCLAEELATVCNRRRLLWSPGCGSLTEIK